LRMRPFDTLTLMQFMWAFLSIIGFSIRTNLRGWRVLFTGLGGGLAWALYLIILYYSNSLLFSIFGATLLVCIYSELTARRIGIPVSVVVICSIIPLVPGSGLYYCMRAYLAGDMAEASLWITKTLMIAGTIAIGIAVVSSVTNLVNRVLNRF